MIKYNKDKYNLLILFLDNLFDFEKNITIINKISSNNTKYWKYYSNIIKEYEKNKIKGKLFIDSYILISHLYEEYIILNNKNEGIFYTPFDIINYMVNNVDIKKIIVNKNINDIKVLDPSAWTWLFVIWILDLLIKQKYSIDEIYSFLQNNIYIFDIDKNSINLLEEFLKVFFRKIYNKKDFKFINKFNDDFLEYKFDKDNKFDIIIWNPPYWLSSKQYKKWIISEIKKIKEFNEAEIKEKDLPNDIYWLFYIKSLLLLEESWIIKFITPNSILNNKTFYGTRKFLLEYIKEIDIIDNTFKKKEIWKKAWIDTVVIKIEKKQNIKNLLIKKIKFTDSQKNTIGNFLILQKNTIGKNKLKEIFLLPFSINLDQEILDILYDTYKNNKYKLIKDYFDSAMWIKTSNNKKYVSNIKAKEFNIPFVKGTSKEEQKNTVKLFDYINFKQLKKDKPKNSNIPQEKFLDMSIYKLWFPEIWHKWIIRSFIYKDMFVSNSVWIFIPKEKYKNKIWEEKLKKISNIINSRIYEKISKIYSNWIRIEKHIIDNLPLLYEIS